MSQSLFFTKSKIKIIAILCIILFNGINLSKASSPCAGEAAFNFTFFCHGYVEFLPDSIKHGTTYFWDFGDGNSTTSINSGESHQYLITNNYSVRLISINSNGCSDTSFQNISVNIVSNLHASYTTSTSLNTVNFTNTSVGAIKNSYWNFGDGAGISSWNASHTYPTPDSFFVQLIVYDSMYCTDTLLNIIAFQSLNVDTLSGTVFQDFNGDGIKDPTDSAIINKAVNLFLPNSFYHFKTAYTDSLGHYEFYVFAGTIEIGSYVPNFNQTLPLTSNYHYSVTVTQNQKINNLDFGFHDNNTSTGIIFNSNKPETSIAPNPMNEFATIRIDGLKGATDLDLTIMNVLGEKVKTLTHQSNIISIDRNDLSSGIYFYELKNNGKKIGNGKIVME